MNISIAESTVLSQSQPDLSTLQEQEDLHHEAVPESVTLSEKDSPLVMSSTIGTKERIDSPPSISLSDPVLMSADTACPAASATMIETQIGTTVPYSRPQRINKPNSQFVEQYGLNRLVGYHDACHELESFIRDVNVEIQRGPVAHTRTKKLLNQLTDLSRVLTTRRRALGYIQLADDTEPTFSGLEKESDNLAGRLTMLTLSLADSETTSCLEESEPQRHFIGVSNPVPHDGVASEESVNLTDRTILPNTSLGQPVRPAEAEFSGIRTNIYSVDHQSGVRDTTMLKGQVQTEANVSNPRSAYRRSVDCSIKSTSTSSSICRVRLSEVAALEVKQRASYEKEAAQWQKQQVQMRLNEAKIKAKLEREAEEAQREAEEAQREAEEAQQRAHQRVRRAEEEARRERETRREIQEMENQLAAIKAKEERDERQVEINAALAAAAALNSSSKPGVASSQLSSLPTIDKVRDLFLSRPDRQCGEIDDAAGFKLRMQSSKICTTPDLKSETVCGGSAIHVNSVKGINHDASFMPLYLKGNQAVHTLPWDVAGIHVKKERSMFEPERVKTEMTTTLVDESERLRIDEVLAQSRMTQGHSEQEIRPKVHSPTTLVKFAETEESIPCRQYRVGGSYDRFSHPTQFQPPRYDASQVYPRTYFVDHDHQDRHNYAYEYKNVQRSDGVAPEQRLGPNCHAPTTPAVPLARHQNYNEVQIPLVNTTLRSEAPEFVPSVWQVNQALPVSQLQHPSINTFRRAEGPHADSATPAATDVQAIVKCLAEAMAITRLPVPKPPVFKGDPLTFPSWIAAFKHLVNSDSIKPEDKMLILRDYIDGPAKQAVGDLYYELSESSYLSALEILQKRFGEDYTIAESLKEKLDSWPNVKAKDYTSLMSFADYLKQCEVMSQKIRGLAMLDDPSQIKKLLQKLPEALSMSWGSRVVAHQNATGSYPEFKTFVSFLQEKTDCLHNAHLKQNQKRPSETDGPAGKQGRGGQTFFSSENSKQAIGGKERDNFPEHDRSKPKDFRGHSNNNNQEKGDGCTFCHGNHHVLDCRKFVDIKPEAKRDFILKNHLCHRCLHNNHFIKGCRAKYECKTCRANHNTALHDLGPPLKNPRIVENHQSNDAYNRGGPKEGQVSVVGASSPDPERVQNVEAKENSIYRVSQLPTSRLYSLYVPVYVSAKSEPHNEVLVYAMLDTMSDTSFVIDQVAEKLSLQERDTCLTLTTLTSTKQTVRCKTYTDLRVRAYDSHDYIEVPATHSRPEICTDKGQIPTREFVGSLPHLKHLACHFYPLFDAPVALLLGVNVSEALRPLQVVSGEFGQPYAQKTRLGWGVVGEIRRCFGSEVPKINIPSSHGTGTTSLPIQTISFRTKDVTNERLIKMMERDFAFPDEQPASQEDQRFMRILTENIKVNEDGHYELPLPFKGDDPQLPNNRYVAYRRLLSLKRKFCNNPDHFQLYKEFIDQMLERGDAEIVPDTDLSSGSVWFVPHHGVFHPNKPGKIRVVFDCAATCQGTSLNDHLLSGPDLLNSLIGVLCRFRLFPVAVSCDVERMFHQFHVTPCHRDYLRFLWWPQNDLTAEPVDHRMRVHLFGAASSPGCANFAFKQLAKDNQQLNPKASTFIQRDFYVDDGLHSDKSEADAIQLLKGARQICEKGNLHLHKIASNSQRVMSSFPETEVVQTVNVDRKVEKSEGVIERALGICWTLEADSLHFNKEFKDRSLTKRGALSMIASIFDPLGLVSPVVLRGRLILQEACRQNLDWDETLPSGLLERWNCWLSDLGALASIQIPRCYFSDARLPWSLVELHHFTDASNSGYGECSYLRVVDSQGKSHCSLVMAKSKVAPLRTVTIPRLELQAAVLAVKIARFLQREFEGLILQHYFWTDSKVVLGYIYNETKRFHIFVANRVQQIRDFSRPQQWHHISTEQNPADHASRGLDVQTMNQSNWYSGPLLLSSEPIVYEIPEVSVADEDKEVKVLRVQTAVNGKEGIEGIVKRFSTLDRLLNVISRILFWVKRIRQKDTKPKQAAPSPLEKTHDTLMRITQRVQQQHFPASLRSTLPEIKRLDVFVDELGIMRVGGRLSQSAETYQIKHPFILPKESHLSTLLVRYHHQKNGHQGRTTTMGALRTAGVWICGARRVVSAVIHRCVHCSVLRGKPETQRMADLPPDRTEVAPPFSYVGLDCFGPFHVTSGRKEVKRYGLILTCLASRAVHLEVLEDMSTDAFICGLRRFVAIRGNVRSIRCDRGTNFIGGERELRNSKKGIDGDRVVSDMQYRNCDFIFNPPSASHFGGAWERLIRTTRGVIEGLLKEHGMRLTVVTLPTLFYEVAAIVNNRPLCADTLEDPSALAPLTPNHLLTVKPEPIFPPPGNFQKDDLYSTKRWRRVQYLVEQFWKRWRTEYLSTLQPRKKWYDARDSVREGMVVILTDESTPRGTWKLARIEKLYPSQDGLVRSVQLRLATVERGKRGAHVVRTFFMDRPVHKIIPLHATLPDKHQDR